MDQLCERDGIAATVIELDQTPPPRRNVRRKLVQSTLVPHKSEEVIESNGDRMRDAGNNGEGEGGDIDVCSSQGKKTRKQREKTPKNGASKKVGSLLFMCRDCSVFSLLEEFVSIVSLFLFVCDAVS